MTGSLYSRVRRWLTPGLENSQFAYVRAVQTLARQRPRWLDVGCGHALVPEWMTAFDPQGLDGLAVGVDVDCDALKAHRTLRWRVAGNGESLPFRDDAFDLITANMVVEHVASPRSLFCELRRVLAPGGRVLIHTPNLESYTTRLASVVPCGLRPMIATVLQQRHAVDVYPTHYRANTADALRAVAESVGLHVDRIEYVLTSPQLIRIAPLMLLEMLWIRRLARAAHARARPVMIATITKPIASRMPCFG